MIKTSVIPKENNLNLLIPNNYIGKEIEILMFAKDEIEVTKAKNKKSFADFTGALSEQDYLALKSHSEQSRKEWNRDI